MSNWIRWEGIIRVFEQENDAVLNILVEEYRNTEKEIEELLLHNPQQAQFYYYRLFYLREIFIKVLLERNRDWYDEYRKMVRLAMGK